MFHHEYLKYHWFPWTTFCSFTSLEDLEIDILVWVLVSFVTARVNYLTKNLMKKIFNLGHGFSSSLAGSKMEMSWDEGMVQENFLAYGCWEKL